MHKKVAAKKSRLQQAASRRHGRKLRQRRRIVSKPFLGEGF
ncbi:hypothetical protein [Lysobacter gummosus]